MMDGTEFLKLDAVLGTPRWNFDKTIPRDAEIVAVDADASMIAAAKEQLQQEDLEEQNRITFLHQSGESLSNDMAGCFDVAWLRFVVDHVPKPKEFLSAAVACLKPDGIFLIEDTCTVCVSSVCEPPMYAHEFFQEWHANATLQLGGDLTRGAKIPGWSWTA